LRVVEAESTAELADLDFDRYYDGELAGIDERITGIFQSTEQFQRFLEAVPNLSRWFALVGKVQRQPPFVDAAPSSAS
jgi:hypothetical protein